MKSNGKLDVSMGYVIRVGFFLALGSQLFKIVVALWVKMFKEIGAYL